MSKFDPTKNASYDYSRIESTQYPANLKGDQALPEQWETGSEKSHHTDSSTSSTLSSITPYAAARKRTETYGHKYLFQHNPPDNSSQPIILSQRDTSKSGYDIKNAGLIFDCANHCAAISQNPDQLVNHTSQIIKELLDDKKSHYPIKSLEACRTKFLEKITEINDLTSLVNKTPETIKNKLSSMAEEEKIIACSQVFEDLRQASKQLRKTAKQNISQIESQIQGYQKTIEDALRVKASSETQQSSNDSILREENQLLCATYKALQKKNPLAIQLFKDYKQQNLPKDKLEADNANLRREMLASKAIPDFSKDLIKKYPEAGTLYQNITSISTDKGAMISYLKNGQLDINTENQEDPAIKITNLQQSLQNAIRLKEEVSQLLEPENTPQQSEASEQPKEKKKRSGKAIFHPVKNLVTYSIDNETLKSSFITKTSDRPYTFDSEHQDDHVTAYVALAESFINSLMPICRAREVVNHVESRLNLVFDAFSLSPSIEKFGHKHRNCDKERTALMQSLPSDFPKEDAKAINRLLKLKNLRDVNSDICTIANRYLTEANAEEFATLEQGGKTNSEDQSVEYISTLNSFFTHLALGNSIKEAQKQTLPQKTQDNLANLLHNIDMSWQTIRAAQMYSTGLPSNLYDNPQVKNIETSLPQHLRAIFDLDLDALENSTQISILEETDDKKYQMQTVTKQLIKRHFRVFGVFAGAALDGLKKNNSPENNLIASLPEKFLDSLFEEESFKQLFSEDYECYSSQETSLKKPKEEILADHKDLLKKDLTKILEQRSYTPTISLPHNKVKETSAATILQTPKRNTTLTINPLSPDTVTASPQTYDKENNKEPYPAHAMPFHDAAEQHPSKQSKYASGIPLKDNQQHETHK